MTFTLPVRSGQIQASCRRITLHRATRSICTIHHWLYVPTRLLLTGHRRQESAPAIRSSPKHVAKQEKARTDHRENQSGVLSAMKERILDCRRFCSGRSTKAQQRATRCWALTATHAIPITCQLQNSIEFNNHRNLVRDQGVGGSNPLSPTNLFKNLNVTSGIRLQR